MKVKSCSPLVVGGTKEDLGVELSACVSRIHHLIISKIKNQKTNNFKQNNTSSTNNFQRKKGKITDGNTLIA